MFIFSLIFAIFAAIFAGGICLANEKKEGAIVAALVTGILSFLVNWGFIYMFQPNFTHILVDGFAWLLFIDMAIAIVVVGFSGDSDMNGALLGAIIEVIALVLWAVIAFGLTSPGPFCDNSAYQELAGLMQVREAKTGEHPPDSKPESLLRVKPEIALAAASSKVPGNIGSYLGIHEAYLQEIGGHWYYIVDLKVTDWWGFGKQGSIIPGFIVVDAEDPDTEARFMGGYAMKYVPGARWSNDLYTHVYLNYLLGSSYHVDDLGTLEIEELPDGKWAPRYSATLLDQTVGFTGRVVSGAIVVDPETGEIKTYQKTNEPNWAPAWINRIWSLELTETYSTWWGEYHNWKACSGSGNSGKEKIDEVNDVVTSQGLFFQVTMTSIGKDTALNRIIYVNPRTGEAISYNIEGAATLQSVDNLMDQASFALLSGKGYEPLGCEMQWLLLGNKVWFCSLGSRGSDEESQEDTGGGYGGVGFLQAKYTTQVDKVIVASSLDEAYRLLQEQIQEEGSDDPELAKTRQVVQYQGTVVRIGYEPSKTGVRIIFILEGEGIPAGVRFRVIGTEKDTGIIAALTEKGDVVTVTANAIPFDGVHDVLSLENTNLPIPVITTPITSTTTITQ